MTNSNINKSKIFMLILGLAMCLALMLGIAMASGLATAFADGETDTRTPVGTVTATSNIDDIIGYDKSVEGPTFNITEGSPAYFLASGGSSNWKIKTATGWDNYSDTVFKEGTYQYTTQIRIDDTAGTTHVLDKNGITVTVNGVKWAENSIPSVYDTFSYDWVASKEYEVVAPAGTPLEFVKGNKWDIDSAYINQAITPFSVADGASGGTKPYTFSKVSGPEWLNVAADGMVSGTPTALGENADLVIKVTDSAADPASTEITLKVGNTYVLPADRTVINVIRATSNIGEKIGYGKSVVKPSFTLTEGTQAHFSGTMGDWYKKEGTAWKIYNEATFTEGIYMYSNQIRVDDEYGMTHVLNKDGVSVYIDGELCADKQKPDGIYDTYSYIYVGTAEYEILGATDITDALVPVSDLDGKVYSGAAQEPTFGGTLARGTDYEVSYATVASGEIGSDGKPVGAGKYSVTVTGKGAYKGNFTKEFEIAKAEQGAPILIAYGPTTDGGSDGKITGTTNKMEYAVDSSFTNPQDCTDGETTGLTEGVYYVRIKETDNYKASATFQVEVRRYKVTVEDGAGTVVKKYRTGDTVTITVNKPTGKALEKWVYGGVTIPDVTKETITFEMPNCDVSLRAVFKDAEYSITVTNGTTTHSKATYQTEVTVKANEPDTDMKFDKWEVTGLDTTDMDLTKAEIKFNMPANNVTFKATYLAVKKYDIVVVDGTKDKSPAKAGETVTITANPAPSGKVFDKWTCETAGVTIEFASATSKQTTFVMPASNVKIQAHFRDIEAAPSIEIKVNGGTGAGTYKQGDSVTVTADAPSAGKVFKYWKDGSGKIVSTNKDYTFTVDGEINLTAVYDNAAAPEIETDGSGKGGSGKQGGTLSGGKIAGIVIGVLAAVGAATAAVVIVIKKKRK